MSEPRPPSREANRLDRAYRLYRRRIRRCRTENQLNRLHIALDNYMTPAEVRYFAAALASDPPDSPSRRWISFLEGSMPVNQVRPAEFERTELLHGVTHYAARASSSEQKTLIIGFAGIHHRLMAPTAWLLDCLNPMLYDMIVLRDFSRRAFALGIPGLGKDLIETLSGLRMRIDPRAYRKAVSLGTSAGGVPAILAAIGLNLQRGISLCPSDYRWYAAHVKALGVNEASYAALMAFRPEPFPELVLVCGAEKKDDLAAALALHALVPSQLWKLRNCTQHGILKWHLARGTLRTFLAKILDQSLENPHPPASSLTAKWIVGSGAGTRHRVESVPMAMGSVSSR